LENYHCNVEVFENGKELINRIETKKPDLILMDIEMSVMNGIETTQYLKSQMTLKTIPVIALTGHAFENEKEQFMSSGFDDYIIKPIDKSQLVKALAKQLHLHRSEL
jgi:CheY-like chemotaxis protein